MESTSPKIHMYSVFSPPELVLDEEEEEEEDRTPIPASPPSTPPSCLDLNQQQQQQQQQQQTSKKAFTDHRCSSSSSSKSSSPSLPLPSSNKRRKCVPHPSPLTTNGKNDRTFTWSSFYPRSTTITSSANSIHPFITQLHQQQQMDQHDDEPQPRIIYLRHRSSDSDDAIDHRPNDIPAQPIIAQPPTPPLVTKHIPSPISLQSPPPPSLLPLPPSSAFSSSPFTTMQPPTQPSSIDHPHHSDPGNGSFSSGRPIRTKGPCQACHESSEACMRKAFDWPFPSDEIYYDKGRPFVYLCNKCGLRYNKSGGSVCRHCRWVLCKEEKRKVIQLIETMRSSGRSVSLDDDIDSFVCAPKYWHCGKAWKVRWIVNLVDEEL